MGSITASVLVGKSHPNHGGLIPTHHLLLSENSRPAWMLTPISSSKPKTVWIPTIEDMLEDALLMVGLLVVGDVPLCSAAKFKADYTDRVAMYDDIDEDVRRHLYTLCRGIGADIKLVISVFEGSSIAGQLGVLANYKFQVEVCPSVFRRELSAWSGKVEVHGELL